MEEPRAIGFKPLDEEPYASSLVRGLAKVGFWAFGSLERPSDQQSLAEFRLDPTVRHPDSCFAAWVREIVAAVKESGGSGT